jgi:hypothetical protein
MKTLALLICTLLPCVLLKAQIPDISYTSAASAANYLAGVNVQITNASFSGDSRQLALFTDGTDIIGFEDGIALTTGNALFAGTHGNSNPGDQMPVNSNASDSDLNAINGSGFPYDAALLEFDVQTTGTLLSFQYVFGSDEYLQYVGSNYNDAFGFIISGPGINGPFSNAAVNIATVNGSPVSVNTINPLSNPAFYIDNLFFNQGTVTEANALFQYDGHTVVMTTTIAVQCNVPYHVKIGICNTNDHIYDSAVFLRRGTLTSTYAPPGPLSLEPLPACEGQPLSLSVEGDASWTYTWSTGQSGVGLQQNTTPASTAIDSYSLTVEYLPGCTLTSSETQGRAVVHVANNAPPNCPGGNLFVQAESILTFSIPTSDAANEEVTITQTSGPGTFSVNTNPIHDLGAIQWSPTENDIGYHTISFQVQDNNVCGPLTSTCQYDVKVMCRYCPTCVYYENRTPSGLPLPEYTVAGACIVAGADIDASQPNGPVIVGDSPVTFEAPSISLEPGFTSGPGFTALVNYNACVEDCEGCCEVMAGGISYNLVPNVFTPNGDGVNDYWQLLDELHPYCAYNANFFDLWIYNSWGGDVVAHRSGQGYCCPFVSRAPGVNVLSSINWDGRANGSPLACNGCYVSNGVYYYVLEIESSCGPVETLTGYIHVFGSPAGGGGGNIAIQQDGRYEVLVSARLSNEDGITDYLIGVDKEVVFEAIPEVTDVLLVYPNPTRDQVILRTSQLLESIQIHDGLGRTLLSDRPQSKEIGLSLGALAPGNYYISVRTMDGNSHKERIIKH